MITARYARARTQCRGAYRCRFHRTGGSGAEDCSGVAFVKPPAVYGTALVSAVIAEAFRADTLTSERTLLLTHLRSRALGYESQSDGRKYDRMKLRADLKRLRDEIDVLLRHAE